MHFLTVQIVSFVLLLKIRYFSKPLVYSNKLLKMHEFLYIPLSTFYYYALDAWKINVFLTIEQMAKIMVFLIIEQMRPFDGRFESV